MLAIEGLRVRYGPAEAVHGVDLVAEPGRVSVLLGPNGAGKSSTLHAVAGLVRPASGRVRLQGREITGRPAHVITRAGIALVPEGRRIFDQLTVLENLRLGAHTTPRGDQAALIRSVFTMFPILEERQQGYAGLLSGGEQQMLAFGRALMSRPTVVLLDEPSMGLAPVMVAAVMDKIREVAEQGIAVLMVEQNAGAVLQVADWVTGMRSGRVIHSASAQDTRGDDSVLRTFLGEAATG